MKKRRRRSPARPDTLKDSLRPATHGYDEALVVFAARRAFAAFLLSILKEADEDHERAG